MDDLDQLLKVSHKKSKRRLWLEQMMDEGLKPTTKFDHTNKALWRYFMKGPDEVLKGIISQCREASIPDQWHLPFSLKVLNAWLNGAVLSGHEARMKDVEGHYACSDYENSMYLWDYYPEYRLYAFEHSRQSSLHQWMEASKIVERLYQNRLAAQSELDRRM